MQTALSRWALREQIQALSPSSRTLFRSSDGDMSLPTQTLESDFRKMWTRLGDELSILYAGSK
ncbi:hypothetical protein EON65_28790 [archaeon]|nr:MAG: hypothetical protein EON65_28790 [archaeon]